MFKVARKIFVCLMILLTLNSCLVMKVSKDSAPLVDFGIPIVGHYRNRDIPKAVLYSLLLITGVIGVILFAPTQPEGKAIIPVTNEQATYAYYSFLGSTLCVPVASSIDTAATYHIVNKKILDLNGIIWDQKGTVKKYEAINKFREDEEKKIEEESNRAQMEIYRDEIESYRKKLSDGTITDEELIFIEKSELIREELKYEIGYYYVNKEKLLQNKK